MSGVNSCCSESASKTLFDQGIQKVQQRDQEEQLKQQSAQQVAKEISPVSEGLKGSLFNAYA